MTDHAARLRHLATDLEDLVCLDVSEEAFQLRLTADRIEELEAAVDLARTESLHQQIAELHATTVKQAEHIGRIEAELAVELLRSAGVARCGCPDCDDETPLPAMRCVRCGRGWFYEDGAS